MEIQLYNRQLWDAPPELKNHQGEAIGADAVFLSAPPVELGPIRSATSTLKKGRRRSTLRRFAWTAAATGVTLLGFAYIWLHLGRDRDSFSELVLTLLGLFSAISVGAIVWMAAKFQHFTTYVGESGIARVSIDGSVGPKCHACIFAQATELRTELTRNTVNGGTRFKFVWSGGNPQTEFSIAGLADRAAILYSNHPYHFALAAEAAWTAHALLRMRDEFKQNGWAEFRLDEWRWVRVGRGYIEFNLCADASPVRIERREIDTVEITKGFFRFRHKDAKFFGRHGKFDFECNSLARVHPIFSCAPTK
ncbi:MAG TPA: hypothetical protein VFE47_22565 [Tepidisphaeraceae bacterium]|jgi:hypothetical protein|nr:hypothetical protein [Tepidisphaeraceae bacterium]